MLPSVRPLVRPSTRRPVWEFAERVQITVAYSKYGVAAWLSRSRLADCCAIPSFRSPPTPRRPRRAYAATAGALYVPPLTSRAQTMRAILLARATVTSMRGLRASIRASHEPAAAPRLAGPADHRAGAEDQQSPDGPLAHLRDGPELLLAAGRLLQRRQPEPGGEVPPGAEALRRRHQRGDRGRRDRADARDRHQPPRDGVGLGTPGDLTIQLLDLLLQAPRAL